MVNVKGRVDKSPCLFYRSVVYNLTTFQEWYVLFSEGTEPFAMLPQDVSLN